MRLHRLTLHNVRGVSERSLTFSDGVTSTGVVIVEGPNEAGKSTLGDALDALLWYRDRSRNADVRSLATVDLDEAPEVEAELQVGEHRLVYRKRFLRRPATELSVTSPRGENLTGDEAHDRVTAILDEHLDVHLWTSMRLRQAEGLEQTGPGGTTGLASALATGHDAGAIGEAELGVLELVRREYERYFTPKTGGEKPLLRDARTAVADHRAELATIDERRSSLAADIDHADNLARLLPRLRDQAEDAEARVAEHTGRLAEVAALTDRVTERERRDAEARNRLEEVRRRHDRRRALAEELTGVESEIERLAGELDAANRAGEGAAERLDTAHRSLETARQRAQRARARREAAQADLDHLHDEAALITLRSRLERAVAAADRLHDAEDRLSRNGVDDEVLDLLRAAQTEVTRTEAVLDAASPEVRLTAVRDLHVRTEEGSEHLAAGADRRWRVQGRRTLRIDEVGELEVRSGAGTDDAVAAHRDAVSRLTEALATAGVGDLAEAEAAARRRHDARRTAEEARRERDAALDGATAAELDAEVERLVRAATARTDRRGDDAPLPRDTAEARSALEEAAVGERAAFEDVEEAEAAVERARAEADHHREAVVEHRTRAEGVERRAEAIRTELDEARRVTDDASLAGELDTARTEADRAAAELDRAVTALAEADPDAVTAHAENADEVAADARRRVRDTERDLRDTQVRIAALGGDGLWERREEAAAALGDAEARLEGLERRAGAARTLLETLLHHRDRARDRYAAPLREQLLRYGRMLYGPTLDLELDDDLRVARRHLDGTWLEVGQLSVGAREQLALLGRLACATLLGGQGGLLLLDDALGNSDPQRLELLGAVLRAAGEHSQVVVLTCYPDRYRHVGGARRITL